MRGRTQNPLPCAMGNGMRPAHGPGGHCGTILQGFWEMVISGRGGGVAGPTSTPAPFIEALIEVLADKTQPNEANNIVGFDRLYIHQCP